MKTAFSGGRRLFENDAFEPKIFVYDSVLRFFQSYTYGIRVDVERLQLYKSTSTRIDLCGDLNFDRTNTYGQHSVLHGRVWGMRANGPGKTTIAHCEKSYNDQRKKILPYVHAYMENAIVMYAMPA